MSDQCKHCMARGDMIACRQTPCAHREEWYVQEMAGMLRSFRASWEERGKLLDRLLVARMVDLASVAMLIDRSPNSDALSELKGIILEAVEVIKGLRREKEVKL